KSHSAANYHLIYFRQHSPHTKLYSLSLHDALPISKEWNNSLKTKLSLLPKKLFRIRMSRNFGMKMLTMTNLNSFLGRSDSLVFRSEERFSRNAETDLVCRLLLEKKNEENDLLHERR